MGEAKRRKQLDPNYGKEKPINLKWFEEMVRNLPPKYKPDYGHIYFRDNLDKELYFGVEGSYTLGNDKYGKMMMLSDQSHCVSILLTNEQLTQFEKSTLKTLKIIPWKEERYKANSGEWVLPFKVLEVL